MTMMIRTFKTLVTLLMFTALWAQAQTAEAVPALQGMDVVSYFKDGGPVQGQAAFRSGGHRCLHGDGPDQRASDHLPAYPLLNPRLVHVVTRQKPAFVIIRSNPVYISVYNPV